MEEKKRKSYLERIKRIPYPFIIGLILIVAASTVITVLNLNKKTPQLDENSKFIQVLLEDTALHFGTTADVYMIIWVDYGCPFCARFWLNTFPKIKKNYIDTNKIMFIVRDFPIPQLHGINPFYVGQYLRCVVKVTGNMTLYNILATEIYQNRAAWLRSNYTNLSHYLLNLIALPPEIHNKIVDCYYYNDTAYEVYSNFQTARALQLRGTPSFFILAPAKYVTDQEIQEIKTKLAIYGINITVIKGKLVDQDYYVIPLIGALPYETFDYILSRVTS